MVAFHFRNCAFWGLIAYCSCCLWSVAMLMNFVYNGRNVEEQPSLSVDEVLFAPNSTKFSTPIDDDDDSTGHRPLLVLHIGPHKTATSTIQCELAYFSPLLLQLRFAYVGLNYGECQQMPTIIDTRGLVSCLDQHSFDRPCNESKLWKHTRHTLAKIAHQGFNVISDEAFSRSKVTDEKLRLFGDLLQEHFRVRIIVVYRHYFSWLLSQYNQHYKPLPNRKKYHVWPDEPSGKPIDTFANWYRRMQAQGENYSRAEHKGNYQLAANVLNVHPVEYLAERWSLVSPNVTIFNMHQAPQGDNVTNNLARLFLPDKQWTVFANRKGKAPGRPNPSLALDYDMIVVQARAKGLLSRKINRRAATTLLERALEGVTNARNLPRVCLNNDELNVFKQQSLAMEQRLGLVSTGNHTAEFEEHVKRFKFCNLNATAIVELSAIQSMLQALNRDLSKK